MVPHLDLERVWWRDHAASLQVSLPHREDLLGTRVRTVDEAAAALTDHVLESVVRPAKRLTASRFVLPPTLLRGNVSSALAGAAVMITASPTATVIDPVAVVTRLVSTGWLTGSGRFRVLSNPRSGTVFARHSCCMLYRLDAGFTCGDCVLTQQPPRRRRPRREA